MSGDLLMAAAQEWIYPCFMEEERSAYDRWY
jgi:hypothetical protein